MTERSNSAPQGESMKQWEEKAREAVSVVNAEYSDETFVSEDYGYFDDIVSAMTRLAKQAYESGLEDAAKMVEECCNSNVDNPAIDFYERYRRSGIRWGGEYSAMRIRALKSDAGRNG